MENTGVNRSVVSYPSSPDISNIIARDIFKAIQKVLDINGTLKVCCIPDPAEMYFDILINFYFEEQGFIFTYEKEGVKRAFITDIVNECIVQLQEEILSPFFTFKV